MTPSAIDKSALVAVQRLATATYADAPFDPGAAYPEIKDPPRGKTNPVYSALREALCSLGMDRANFGSSKWNPFRELIKPGDRVALKPNLLWHSHRDRPSEWVQVITHGSIVRAAVDYVLLALQGRGEVIIADGPQLDADWAAIVERAGLKEIVEHYRRVSDVPVRLLDLRTQFIDRRDDVSYSRQSLPGDPEGQRLVELGRHSRFCEHDDHRRYYGADYDRDETNTHHHGLRHDYGISETIARADVFINLPKMKTHKKVGVTLSLKNLVGITTARNWLPHHSIGTPAEGGDQFPNWSVRGASEAFGVAWFERKALNQAATWAPVYRFAKKLAKPFFGATGNTIRNGNWSGNDTAWRMVHDLNRCLSYSNDGVFPSASRKRYFSIIDGVIGGDGNGPASPDSVASGLLVAGHNPVSVDCVATRLMGFDPMRLRILSEVFEPSALPLVDCAYEHIVVNSNVESWNGPLHTLRFADAVRFRPHFGWAGSMESNPAA